MGRVDLRFLLDRDTDEPHIYGHGVTEEEVEEVLANPVDEFGARGDSRIALGQTEAGRYLQVVYVRTQAARAPSSSRRMI